MFKTIFCKTIWDCDSPESSKYFVIFQREEHLPFAPTFGVEIFWGRDMPQAPEHIRWNVSDSTFVCTMKNEFPHEDEECEYDFDWLVANAVKSGWTLIGKNSV
jgi:hypothetical protein